MKTRNLILFLAGVLIVTGVFYACKHVLPFDTGTGGGGGNGGGGNTNPPPVSNCSPDTVYFANTILPLLTSNCAVSGCHDPARKVEGLVLNSYSGIMKIVTPGNASASKLYHVIVTANQGDRMPPPPMAPLSAAQIADIQKWINQGAKNNACSSGCDTTVFTYSGAVVPVMNNYCKGCHNPASLGGGVDLSSYAGVKAVADNGKLLGSITHAAGYSAMPKNGNKLSDCQIAQIQKWIQAGKQNN